MKFLNCLTALFAVVLSTSAAPPIVLYQTGWEAAPASPAWVPGLVVPQNGWLNFNSTAAHAVVANGTAGAIILGQAVVTPYGSQFHKFTANPSTTSATIREAYPNLTAALAALPATHKVIKVSTDVLVPASQADAIALHGIIAGHGTPGATAVLPWGVMVDPSDLSVNLWLDNAGVNAGDYVTDAFEYDTWFNISVTANYNTGEITVAKDGTIITELTRTSTMLTAPLTHITLSSWNYYPPAAETLRSVCSDNLLITAQEDAITRPALTITPIPPDNVAYKLRWPAANSSWILEYTDDLVTGGSVWFPQGGAVSTDADPNFVFVEVGLDTAHRYFRLRQP